MSYTKSPKKKPSSVDICCSCPADKQIPIKGSVAITLERGMPVDIIKYWCVRCGYYLTTKDQDRCFPAPEWRDNRPAAAMAGESGPERVDMEPGNEK